jgi:RNA polymerase sigma factor (sigma-70 family)
MPHTQARLRSDPRPSSPVSPMESQPANRPMPDPILPRIAAGDATAVSECLARYGGLVWGLARRFLGNSADADDATQDVFVQLWKSASRYDPTQAAEATFVTLIARRRLIDLRRKTGRRPLQDPLPHAVPERPADHFATVDQSDDVAQAAAALNQLSTDQRSAIRLAVYDGLTHEEISTQMGLPLGTVKTHIRRGLMRIRELLAIRGFGRGGAS